MLIRLIILRSICVIRGIITQILHRIYHPAEHWDLPIIPALHLFYNPGFWMLADTQVGFWLQVAAAVLAVCVLVLAVGSYSHSRVALAQDFSHMNQMLARKVAQDERRLQSDVMKQQQMLKMEGAATQSLEARKYPDGCVCECPATGCDEENHEGPVCHCPTDGSTTSLPGPMAPWPFQMPGAARGGRSQGTQRQALYSKMQQVRPAALTMQPHARPMQQQPVRFQQKWVGSPQKFLPPDGDYPGGSTGIPLDGYLAYETGWANDGPFHGELAPMQVDRARTPQICTQTIHANVSCQNRFTSKICCAWT